MYPELEGAYHPTQGAHTHSDLDKCDQVGGHYPVWTGCAHAPTPVLVAKLKPLLEKYHATGYMCGHDHCEEYIDEGLGPKHGPLAAIRGPRNVSGAQGIFSATKLFSIQNSSWIKITFSCSNHS